MTDEVISEDVKQFILQYIDSIAQWEGLLLIRANPKTEWDAKTLARNLYINEPAAAEVLTHLFAQGFLIKEGSRPHYVYQYQPRIQETERIVAYAADLYVRHLVPFTHFVHSKAKKRIQEFADAFRLRKD